MKIAQLFQSARDYAVLNVVTRLSKSRVGGPVSSVIEKVRDEDFASVGMDSIHSFKDSFCAGAT